MTDTVDAQPQVGTATEATPAAAETEKFDAEYVKSLRKESAQYRTQAKELAAKVATYEAEKLSETERLQAQAKAAQTEAQAAREELKRARYETALAREAAKVGIDPSLLTRLVEPEYDAEGKPSNVGAAVAAVLDAYPQLKPQAPTPGATNPGRVAKLTVDDIKKMSPEQINARWDEVQAAMKAGR